MHVLTGNIPSGGIFPFTLTMADFTSIMYCRKTHLNWGLMLDRIKRILLE